MLHKRLCKILFSVLCNSNKIFILLRSSIFVVEWLLPLPYLIFYLLANFLSLCMHIYCERSERPAGHTQKVRCATHPSMFFAFTYVVPRLFLYGLLLLLLVPLFYILRGTF